jgi:N6-adenosine-specific RNA methylase IME4
MGEAIQSATKENSVLFLWATAPMLPDALAVMESWGYEYKAQFVWDKVRHNYGHYNSVRHELLLIGVRGSCLPESKTLHDSVVTVERTSSHSQKPLEFYSIIESLYPLASGKTASHIELFVRPPIRDGWDAMGDELSETGS